MPNFYRAIVGLIFFTLLAGCGTTKTQSLLHDEEVKLGTDAGNVEQFHALVYYPQEHALKYPGLIVGIEKSGSKLIKDEAKSLVLQPPSTGNQTAKTEEWLRGLLKGDSKSMFISHVVESNEQRHITLLQDAYKCKTLELEGVKDTSCSQFGSWNAIAAVQAKVREALVPGKYSHVVFLTMGWNTNQVEAVQNFNSLVRQLSAEAHRLNQRFDPYVIGVTWPSQWDSGWFEDVYRGISLGNKANDADEVGAGWLGAVLSYGVLPATRASATKVIVIGHSFGARATSHAVCRGTLLQPPKGLLRDEIKPMKNDVQWLIGLQAGYSLNRFYPKGAGLFADLAYDPKCEVASNHLLTASIHDSAAQTGRFVLGAPFAGSIGTWTSLLNAPSNSNTGDPSFELYKAHYSKTEAETPTVCLAGKAGSGTKSFKYVDASEVIKFKAYGTGGGAHSDIYRDQTAKLMWNFMNASPFEKCH